MKLLQNKTNVSAPDATYPYGNLKNDTGTGAGDGTPVDVEMLTDYVQVFEKIFADSGLTANGLPDNATNGFQLYDALNTIMRPRPYKSYSSIISQVGTAAPTEIILENGLSGAITWARSGVGVYNGTLTGAFVSNKTWLNSINVNIIGAEVAVFRVDANTIRVVTYNGGVAADDVLGAPTGSGLEIRVYD